MRVRIGLPFALAGLGALAPAQPFGFTHRTVPAEAESPLAIALGDIDGDGDLDMFQGAWGGLSLYENEEGGVFRDVTVASFPSWFNLISGGEAAAFADFDGDGDLDLVTSFWTSGGGQVRLLLNGGAGVFTPTYLPVAFFSAYGLAVGDLDADADLDTLLAGPDRLLLNNGNGGFVDVTATNLPVPAGGAAFEVALGDVDGDGDLDAFFAQPGFDRLYLNSGAGVFVNATATNLPATPAGNRTVALGDVDGDLDLDALLGGSFGQPRLYLNAGTGVFADATATSLPLLPGNTFTFAVALGDVDGDADLDALLGFVGGAPPVVVNRLLLNLGGGVFADVTGANLPAFAPPFAPSSAAVALGDVDRDGDLDAYAGAGWTLFGRQDRLYLNDGAGTFTDVTSVDLPALAGSTALGLGDLDGDGDPDAFFGGQQERVYLNDGAGGFLDVTSTSLPILADATQTVSLGDVDADGDFDAITGNYGGTRLFLNAGAAVFADATATNLPALGGDIRAVVLGDVDGDGDSDAYLGIYGLQDRLYLNAGPGVFADATATNLPPLPGPTLAAALGDVDADGDLDAFLGSWQARLLLNDGTGAFTDVTATNLPTGGGRVALGDVDGDGDLDAFLGNSLFLNVGAGLFADATATNLPALYEQTLAVVLADLDEDGDLDALQGNIGQNRLLLNGGGGVFADATAATLPSLFDATSAVAVGDLDADGDLDAFAAAAGQDRIYTNLSRQLSWRGIPRAGKPLALDVRGPATGTWLLAWSAATANIPVPSVGMLRLDPPGLFLFAGGPLDAEGRGGVSFPVPANPALVGLSLYWQALVGPPLRFTNLEVTTVTNL